MSLSNDVYGRTVELISSDGVIDLYSIGGTFDISFPAGTSTPVVYIAIARQANMMKFQAALNDFILSKYSVEQRLNLLGLYLNAQAQSLTNRTAYIAQIMTWQNSIISYAATYSASINALTDPNTIYATMWDFTGIIADPGITAFAAVAINS